MLIRQRDVCPGFDAEIGRVDMDMEPAAVVDLYIAQVKYPGNGLEFLQSFLADQDGANQFECVVSMQAAVGRQFPMSASFMVVALDTDPNPCFL